MIPIKGSNFCSLQSDSATSLLKRFHTKNDPPYNSVYLISNDTIHQKSDAIIMLLKIIRKYPLIIILLQITPKTVRDFGYDIISKNRFLLFKPLSECRVFDQSVSDRFIN